MNSRFKKLLISILLIIIGSGYMYYVVKKILNDKKQIEIQEEEAKQEKIKTEEKKEVILTEIVQEDEELTSLEKIQDLKDKHSKYAYFKLDNIGSFYFEEESEKLGFYYSGEKIGTFDIAFKDDLGVQEIIGNINYVFVNVGEDKFLLNLKTKKINEIDLKLDVEYIKVGINSQELLFKTKVGIFTYIIGRSDLEYFVFFEDFVYYNNGYLGIINKDEDTKLKNLGFEKEGKNLIVYYNPTSKEKNIIYKTELNLKKIYYNQEKIYFEDYTGQSYELNNLN